jgi:hypothetical protein
MTSLLDWPALMTDTQSFPSCLEYERGVWGKVHGASTDYRWIAQSPEFGRDRPDLQRQINLGAEDVPCRVQAWRNLGDRCCAVTIYASQAIDATGRRGFLEKQILEWRRPASVPAALGALALLTRVAELTDAIWWDSNFSPLVSQSGIHLRISDADHSPIAIEEVHLLSVIERGRQALREAVSEQSLEQLYDQLLSGQQPACLSGLQRPLPAEAVAALLLPLPRDIADRISVAGWIPASRPALAELGTRWDVLVIVPGQIVPSFPSRSQMKARRMVEWLLEEDARSEFIEEVPTRAGVVEKTAPPAIVSSARPFRPGVELQLTSPAPDAAFILTRLHEFAVSPDRRWLDPLTLTLHVRSDTQVPRESARVVLDWVRQLHDQRGYADKRQWQVKMDLLRSAAIVLVPEPATLAAVGRPDTQSRIPALLFGLMFDRHQDWDRLAGFGDRALRDLLEQSLTCSGAKRWGTRMRAWLERWQIESRRQDISVRRMIGEVLKACPA